MVAMKREWRILQQKHWTSRHCNKDCDAGESLEVNSSCGIEHRTVRGILRHPQHARAFDARAPHLILRPARRVLLGVGFPSNGAVAVEAQLRSDSTLINDDKLGARGRTSLA